jgi:hypothetical protein
MEESLAPEADHIAAHGESGGDLVVALPFGCEEEDPGPEHLKVWYRILLSCFTFEDGSFLRREVNWKWALSRYNRVFLEWKIL